MVQEIKRLKDSVSILGSGPHVQYRVRTRLEHAIFDVIQQYTLSRLGYRLGGLSQQHKQLFEDAASIAKWDTESTQPISQAFALYIEILNLSPSDPSFRSTFNNDPGASLNVKVETLRPKLLDFIASIDDLD